MKPNTNLTVICLRDGQLMLWRAGAAAAVPVVPDVELPADVMFAAPGDQLRLLTLEVTPEEAKHLRKSLPFMLEDALIEDVATLQFAHQRIVEHCYRVAICRRSAMQDWQSLVDAQVGVSMPYVAEPMLLPWQEGEWTLLFDETGVLLRDSENTGTRIETELLTLLLSSAEPAPESLVVYGHDRESALSSIPADWHSKVQWRQGGFGTALLLTTHPAAALDLRQGDFAPRLPIARWWLQWRHVAAAAAAALLIQFGADFAEFQQLSAQNTQLRSAIQASYRRANPKGAVVDVEKQLDRQLQSLAAVSGGVPFMPLLKRLSDVLAASEGVSLTTLNYSGAAREMRLNIMAPDYAAVEGLRNRLAAAQLNATLESSSAANGQVRARLRLEDEL
jgi:type II secretion system protein L